MRKSSLLRELAALDELDEGVNLVNEGLERKCTIIRELDHIIDLEEVNWRQKSQALWLKDGDKCTKCFHSVANSMGSLILSPGWRLIGMWWKI